MREGHLRPRRKTCDLEGREEDHIVVVVQIVIIGSRERPVELDDAKHCREVLQKKSASSIALRKASVRRQLQAAESSHARESLWGAAPCRDAGVKMCRYDRSDKLHGRLVCGRKEEGRCNGAT